MYFCLHYNLTFCFCLAPPRFGASCSFLVLLQLTRSRLLVAILGSIVHLLSHPVVGPAPKKLGSIKLFDTLAYRTHAIDLSVSRDLWSVTSSRYSSWPLITLYSIVHLLSHAISLGPKSFIRSSF